MDRSVPLRDRIKDGEVLTGLVVKFSTHQVVEVLAQSEIDFIMIDAEHAPFDANSLDVCLLAARASGLPAVVRVPEMTEAWITGVLDMGATGIVVPKVRSAQQAEKAVQMSRYSGSRGYSRSPRANDYDLRSMKEHIARSDENVVVITLIEDVEGIEACDEITSVQGIDGILVGRADLTVSMKLDDLQHPDVESKISRLYDAAKVAKKPLAAPVGANARIADMRESGVSIFLVGTDQGTLKNAVNNAALAVKSATP